MDGQGRRSAAVSLAEHSDVWYFPGAQWKWLRIPISKLNLPGSVITGIFIESESASEIHFDRVRFESVVTLYEGIRNQRGPTNMLWNWGSTVSETYAGEDGSLSATFNQSWGGLQFEIHGHSQFWAHEYGLFTALVQTTGGAQDLYAYLLDADTGQAILPAVRLGEFLVGGGNIPGGAWQRVLIPMSEFLKGRNGANVRIGSLMFENQVAGNVLLDDVAFMEAFKFPLNGYTGANVNIITAPMDHSMTTAFCPDGVVEAFTGERGQSGSGSSYVTNQGCGALYGFGKLGGGEFSLFGQYKYYVNNSPDRFFLFYDGHPGVDYGVGIGTNVLATASGKIRMSECPSSGGDCTGYGKLQIDHGNTLVTSYNHLSSVIPGIAVGSYVKKGQLIAKSGNTSPTPTDPHLHLSVLWTNASNGTVTGWYIDPHGWKGPNADPYTRAKNVCLWEGGC